MTNIWHGHKKQNFTEHYVKQVRRDRDTAVGRKERVVQSGTTTNFQKGFQGPYRAQQLTRQRREGHELNRTLDVVLRLEKR